MTYLFFNKTFEENKFRRKLKLLFRKLKQKPMFILVSRSVVRITFEHLFYLRAQFYLHVRKIRHLLRNPSTSKYIQNFRKLWRKFLHDLFYVYDFFYNNVFFSILLFFILSYSIFKINLKIKN